MAEDKNDDPWAEAVTDVTPIKKDGKKKPEDQHAPRHRPRPHKPAPSLSAPSGSRHQVAFDPKLFNNIADGKVRMEARLDLHGITEADAHERLVDMIEDAWADGKRRLLVITGKGRGGTSSIRAALPKWLTSPNLTPYVISFDYAAPRHGGDGAFYVLLRKQS